MLPLIHTLVYDNIPPVLCAAHKAVCQHFNLDVAYTHKNIKHGIWLDDTMKHSDADVVGFFDIDCVPTNKQIVEAAIDYARQHQSFIGIAQSSNHLAAPANSHIFAAPAFFFIHRTAWYEMDCPTFDETHDSDTAQNVSRRADHKGKKYRCLYPTHWDKLSHEGIWQLGNYGVYGIGTHFYGGVYHLYQSRFNANTALFAQRCAEIQNGTFTVTDMNPAVSL